MAEWFLVGGILALVAGSEAFLRGLACLGRAWRMSALLTGLFFLSWAVCGPQAAITLVALKAHARELVMPLLVGANIVTLLLILGLGAIASPLSTAPKVLIRDGGALFVATVALAFLAADGTLSRTDGIVLAAGAIGFLVLTFATDWRRSCEASPAMQRADLLARGPYSATASIFLAVLGVMLLALGANFTLAGSLALVRDYPVSSDIFALTLLAGAAALPSVLTALTAIAARRTPMIVGHLFGIALFNIVGVAAVAAILRPLPVSRGLHVDIIVMLAAIALLLPLLAMRWRLSRLQGASLMACYVAYLGFLGWSSGMVLV